MLGDESSAGSAALIKGTFALEVLIQFLFELGPPLGNVGFGGEVDENVSVMVFVLLVGAEVEGWVDENKLLDL